MPTKRGRLVKNLRKMVAELPPGNFAPWKEPTNTLKRVIDKSSRGKLDETMQEVQEGILKTYMEKIMRKLQ